MLQEVSAAKASTMTPAHPCPICDDARRKPLYRTRDRHYRIPGEWTVAKCVNCGLIQIDPMLTISQLMPLYPADFYAFQDQTRSDRRFASKIRRALFPSLYVRDPDFATIGRILDSGCGTGWALIKFKEFGWECVGVEPSLAAARFGRERYDLDIRGGTVHTERFPDEHFTYIRSNHSLEHDPDVGATLREFHRILKRDGRLLIGVPNIDSAPARWFGKYWWYLGAPVHTYNFSTDQLRALLKRHGFSVESVRYTGSYAGIVGSLQIYLNRNRPERTSSEGWVFNSKICQLAGQAMSVVLNVFHCGDAIEVIARRAQ